MTADGSVIPAVGKGTVKIAAIIDGKREEALLKDVWFVPKLSKNLFSVLST